MGIYFRPSKRGTGGTWYASFKPAGAPKGTLKRVSLEVHGEGGRAEAEVAFRRLTGRPATRRTKVQRRRIARETWKARLTNGRPDTFYDAVVLWEEHLQRLSHMKRSSVEAYKVQTRRWKQRWLIDTLAEVDEAELLRWFEERSGEGLARATLKAEVQTLRVFFRWCKVKGWIEREPNWSDAGIKVRGVSRKEPRPLSLEQVGALLDAIKRGAPGKHGTHPQVQALLPFIAVQVHCGLRREEARFLRWEDVDLDSSRPTLRVTHKKALGFTVKDHEERSVPIHPQLVELLKRERDRRAGPWVCPNERGGQWSLAVSRWVNLAFRAAGIPVDDGTCHRLRHTFATNWSLAGGDLGTLRKLLGHSSLEVTSRYVGALLEQHSAVATLPALPGL